MVRKTTITLEEVSTAAKNLQTQGIKPTSRAVHAEIGYGSMGTILRLLQQWQNNQGNNSQVIDINLDPNIARAINNTITARVQETSAELATKLADLQFETVNLISENERQSDVIESQLIEQSELQAKYASAIGRIQQLEIDVIKTNTELSAERQTSGATSISLAKAELRLEAVPKFELENEKLRAEIDILKIKTAESHQSEAVALTKVEAAQINAKEAREATIKSHDATEALREKYEKLLANAMDKERATAKLLESERLTSQSLQSINESAMRELISAQRDVKEAREATKKALEESARLNGQRIKFAANTAKDDILNFDKNDPSEFNELEALGVL